MILPDPPDSTRSSPESPMFLHDGERGGSTTGIANDCPFDWHWPDPNPMPRIRLFRSPWRTHLEAVTPRENVTRGSAPTAINARKTHCVNGHEFTPENTDTSVGRHCKTCNRISASRKAKR